MNQTMTRYLPADDVQRMVLHDEIHTRPSATFKLPALISYVAVLNKEVDKAAEWAHLRLLPSNEELQLDAMKGNFLQLQCPDYKVIWERHTEFTRYTVFQPLPAHAQWGSHLPELTPYVATGTDWLRNIPGKTITAIHLAMLNEGIFALAPTGLNASWCWQRQTRRKTDLVASRKDCLSWKPTGSCLC